jgi:hypothetical protein
LGAGVLLLELVFDELLEPDDPLLEELVGALTVIVALVLAPPNEFISKSSISLPLIDTLWLPAFKVLNVIVAVIDDAPDEPATAAIVPLPVLLPPVYCKALESYEKLPWTAPIFEFLKVAVTVTVPPTFTEDELTDAEALAARAVGAATLNNNVNIPKVAIIFLKLSLIL